ncbi:MULTISPECIES: hypothetical protein [unclassified Chryseobacterium]|uniref:hypothetical protein n=1 Tax=unclassified Chryseobacterium TaxID=2593645 RepID=UPI0019220D12|nr:MULTISPECIES: hypothetical protein [unclassified Chryseobacterium]MBL3547269.1 hypothetical protein [Chryseobacterium sp. KMC2]
MKKDNTVNWLNYLIQITADERLTVWHITLLLAIIKIAYIQNDKEIIFVSRSKLMFQSHIKTTPTYHKYFKELQDFGYIKYTPSYHPDCKSTIDFLNFKIVY